MIKWEDIVKDKLEGYEKPLQDGSLARFHVRRDSAAGSQESKRFPIFWVMAAAVAAGIAALLFLRRPGVSGDAIQIIPQPSEAVAVSMDSVVVCKTAETAPLLAMAATPKVSRLPMETPVEAIVSVAPVDMTAPEDGAEDETAEESETPVEELMVSSDTGDVESPFVPAVPDDRLLNADVDVANAATSIVGGSGIALACIYLPGLLSTRDYGIDKWTDGDYLKDQKHYLPLRTGISVRLPISDRFSITSGIDYSLYFSRFHFEKAGLKIQSAHYLGIPLRLDGTLESNKKFDVYVGGGLEADYCISALLNGNITEKSGLGLSLLAAGGIQYNLTEYLGLYIEPELSLPLMRIDRLPISNHTINPLEFSINTGIRITICK